MAVWQFDFMIIPKGRIKENFQEDDLISWSQVNLESSTEEFFKEILTKEKSWCENIILFGNGDKTCIKIFNENGIQEVSCRIDLRDISKGLLLKIIEYIKEINGDIYYKEEIYEVTFQTIVELLKSSDAIKFCTNPQQYFEKIDNIDKKM